MTELSRNNKGCFSVGDRVLHSINREIEFKTCIGNFYRPWVIGWLEMHSHFENGVLPYPGSMMDQPNKAVEVFRTISRYKIDKAIRDQERESARAKRGR